MQILGLGNINARLDFCRIHSNHGFFIRYYTPVIL